MKQKKKHGLQTKRCWTKTERRDVENDRMGNRDGIGCHTCNVKSKLRKRLEAAYEESSRMNQMG